MTKLERIAQIFFLATQIKEALKECDDPEIWKYIESLPDLLRGDRLSIAEAIRLAA